MNGDRERALVSLADDLSVLAVEFSAFAGALDRAFDRDSRRELAYRLAHEAGVVRARAGDLCMDATLLYALDRVRDRASQLAQVLAVPGSGLNFGRAAMHGAADRLATVSAEARR